MFTLNNVELDIDAVLFRAVEVAFKT